MSHDVWVYADWEEFTEPVLVGILSSDLIKGKESFRFVYDKSWLRSSFAQQIDPELHLYAGNQYSNSTNQNFRIFLDSCPDRWGRLLMKRREAIESLKKSIKPKNLTELDYLLGVHDSYRMGALRFKTSPDGDFLDNNDEFSAPPMASLRELEYATSLVESDSNFDNESYSKWLNMLMSPGSSLGGARPKACIIENDKSMWIAKFPSRFDTYDIGAWEFLVYQLAISAGIHMAESRIEKFHSSFHTFITKRFDRTPKSRLHFTSALTQLGYYDGNYEASYLELAQFLVEKGSQTKVDLEQLWRRIVFNIAVSNTDDHLRNHGFIYNKGGWILSPAYDINPVHTGSGLHLNITDLSNQLDYNLALEIIDFFQLTKLRAEQIKSEVMHSVGMWQQVANKIGISRSEQLLMAPAFNV